MTAHIGQVPPPDIAVEVIRGGEVESVHRAHVAVVDADGRVVQAMGDPHVLVFGRSALKPLLATVMVDHGFAPVDVTHAAVAASSHSGEPMHAEAAEGMLTAAGLDPSFLANTPDWPYDEISRVAWIAAGGQKSRLLANCSGKHAAMLATCVANGWPTNGYLDPMHPLVEVLATGVGDLVGYRLGAPAVDGCGAPVWTMPLAALARGFAGLVAAPPGSPGATIADAMRAAPEYVGGTRRDVTALMRAFPGMVAKDGADAVYIAGLPDGRAVAVKVEDGSARARAAAMGGALAAAGLAPESLAPLFEAEQVLGGGVPAGRLRPTVALSDR